MPCIRPNACLPQTWRKHLVSVSLSFLVGVYLGKTMKSRAEPILTLFSGGSWGRQLGLLGETQRPRQSLWGGHGDLEILGRKKVQEVWRRAGDGTVGRAWNWDHSRKPVEGVEKGRDLQKKPKGNFAVECARHPSSVASGNLRWRPAM